MADMTGEHVLWSDRSATVRTSSVAVTWTPCALPDVTTSARANWRNALHGPRPSVTTSTLTAGSQRSSPHWSSGDGLKERLMAPVLSNRIYKCISPNTTDVYFVANAMKFNADVRCFAVKDSHSRVSSLHSIVRYNRWGPNQTDLLNRRFCTVDIQWHTLAFLRHILINSYTRRYIYILLVAIR